MNTMVLGSHPPYETITCHYYERNKSKQTILYGATYLFISKKATIYTATNNNVPIIAAIVTTKMIQKNDF